jgi:predicted dehydrogenase
MLRVAIIGCGKIADSHASQIRRISGCELVAVCDREELMARQFSERFGVPRWFSGVEEMIRLAQPQVVHITTPPQSHFPLARLCLEAGVHVYVEKPFTLNTAEAEALVQLAQERGLKLTAGHDDQFSHVARRLRQLAKAGYLGGEPVHMESVYGYEMSGSYARALLGDREHWVRKLPGGLLQNIISHGIARIAEYCSTPDPTVIAHGFVSPFLADLGERQIIDELRVIISEKQRLTAYFTFSSQMRPCLHQFRIYGPENGLMLDEDHQSLVRLEGRRLKSYAEKFLSPVRLGMQHVSSAAWNVRTFLVSDFHMKSGMKCLTESFYHSITDQAPLPISYEEILRVSRMMDSIFRQIAPASAGQGQRSPR